MHKTTAWAAIALMTLGTAGAAWANGNGTSNGSTATNKTSSTTGSTNTSSKTTMRGTTTKTTSATAKTGATKGESTACKMDDTTRIREVLGFLHGANQAEIKLGKLAQEKSSNADVKSFADQMVKEHGDADKKLSDLAKKEGIDLDAYAKQNDPLFTAVDEAHDALYGVLSSKTGEAFDIAYLSPQVLDHQVVIDVIKQGEKSAKTADEKTFFADANKMVSTHLSHAKTLEGDLKITPKAIGGGPMDKGATTKTNDSNGATKSDGSKSTTKSGTMSGATSGTGNAAY